MRNGVRFAASSCSLVVIWPNLRCFYSIAQNTDLRLHEVKCTVARGRAKVLALRSCTTKLGRTLAGLTLISAVGCVLCAQSPEVGNRKKLIFHDIRTDAQGHIVPWYADEPGTAYDHVLGLLWRYWKYMPNFSSNDEEFHRRYRATAGVKKYFVFRTLDEPGVGGDILCNCLKRKRIMANECCATFDEFWVILRHSLPNLLPS